MKYYLIAGEASGDLHGSNLIKALQREDQDGQFRAWGGDLMEATGATLVKHYRDLAFMGFWEVARNLRTIFRNLAFCREDVLAFQPDVLILIDYPGFNLRIAKWAKTQGIRVFYYISPQLWAWHSSRVHGIRKSVDRMFVILPFEKDFYATYDFQVDFIGHPLLDVIEQFRPDSDFDHRAGQKQARPLIALLPGSRRQEISRMLDVMLSVVPAFPDHRFVIAGAPSIPKSFYEEILAKHPGIEAGFVQGKTYDLLSKAKAAVVTSGTATLETGLFGVPQIVCYKGSRLSYLIARRLVNVKYISLVNLILDQALVRELIQEECNTIQLKKELDQLLADPVKQTRIREGYAELRRRLGSSGASARAARLMTDDLVGR